MTHRDLEADQAGTEDIAAATARAVDKGLQFLWEEQEEDGWWRDFWTPAGVADEWVTAYVGVSCAELGDDGRRLAETAWRRLVSRPRPDGWGYHDGVPGDGDSTLWALRLADRLGLGGSRRVDDGRLFLDRHVTDDGVTTYADDRPIRAFLSLPDDLSFAGWCSPHVCVTAAALPVLGRRVWPALRRSQEADGRWPAYWWLDDAYATGAVLEGVAEVLPDLVQSSDDDRRALQRAADWCRRALTSHMAQPRDKVSPFVLAWLVRGLDAAGRLFAVDDPGHHPSLDQETGAARRLLVELQKKHGGWQATARLRVPRPSCTEPVDDAGRWQRWLGLGSPLQDLDDKLSRTFDIFSIDQNGAFTTATVLAALTGPRRQHASGSTARRKTAPALDPFSDAFKQDPYPCYEDLRRSAPVSWIDSLDAWGISRFDDVRTVLKDFRRFSSSVQATMDQPLLSTDPPEHTRIRRVLARSFSTPRLAAFHDAFSRRADTLISKMEEAGGGDLVADLTRPLTRAMAAELLRIPPERHDDFMRWADDMVDLYTRLAFVGGDQSARLAEVGRSLDEIRLFFLEEHLPRCAADGQGLLGELLRDDQERGVLSAEEALSFAKLFLVAGTETSRNLLGNTAMALLAHPQELDDARQDPELVPALVEEAMRWDAAVQLVLRRVTEDVELAGRSLRAGDKIAVLIGSANRDEAAFHDAGRFNPRRAEKHIGFGTGPHYCLGAHLARIEAAALVRRLTESPYRWLADESLPEAERIPSYVLRGPQRLRLRLEAV